MGETGAGKSILLDAWALALGARGDASLVRHGASQGQVTAAFDVPVNHAARAILVDNAIDDDGDIILKRVQAADGRTRVFVNDQPASVALMRDIGRALVEIHGQHDERALVEPAAHRDLLDAFGGHVGRPTALPRAGAGAAPTRNWPTTGPGSRRQHARRNICAPRRPNSQSSIPNRARRPNCPSNDRR